MIMDECSLFGYARHQQWPRIRESEDACFTAGETAFTLPMSTMQWGSLMPLARIMSQRCLLGVEQ